MPASQTRIVRYRIGEAAAISQPASCPAEALPRSSGWFRRCWLIVMPPCRLRVSA